MNGLWESGAELEVEAMVKKGLGWIGIELEMDMAKGNLVGKVFEKKEQEKRETVGI